MKTSMFAIFGVVGGAALAAGGAFVARDQLGVGIAMLVAAVAIMQFAAFRLPAPRGEPDRRSSEWRRMIGARHVAFFFLPVSVFLHILGLGGEGPPVLILIAGLSSFVMGISMFVFVMTRISIDSRAAKAESRRK